MAMLRKRMDGSQHMVLHVAIEGAVHVSEHILKAIAHSVEDA